MDQEVASSIQREHFQQQAPAHIRIINARRNAKGAIMAITHQNATAARTVQHCDNSITVVSNVDKVVVDVEEN